ncbi:MAG TPA: sulfurtransferase-like selenium metabolism protein YedF [Syntrophomonadaceae bacterium]|jgi:selenium metabolism protein YedF|nr:sulfurtransferase-like selenium metabolism protein YedF [Syntrophomonadaceae bacterium]
MKQTIDARGLNCPEPVIMTKKALDSQDVSEVLAIVDNRAALENISRLVKTMNLGSMVEEQDGLFYINITKEEAIPQKQSIKAGATVVVKSNVLGQGDDVLGSVLMKSFLYTLTQMEGELETLIFLNGGVLLTTAGSEVLEHIKNLAKNGVEVMSCGTCLDFYGLTDKLEVGSIGNMYTIAEEMFHARKLIVL